MRFLLFNIVVLTALFMLATKDGEVSESLSAGLKSAEETVREAVDAAISEKDQADASAGGIHVAGLPVDAVAKDMGPRQIDPAEFAVKPLAIDETKKYADEKTPPPPPSTPPAVTGTDSKKPLPRSPKLTRRVRVAEGQTFMSPKSRRRELNALARDMESLFLDKITE